MELISITEDDPSDASGPNVNPMPILAYAECTDDNTNFRMGASTSYPSMGKVQTGEHLDILGVTETGWFHAIWNGLTGYITMDYSQ
ncbi:MAG: SH3 domain-containing protein, partial [Clostridia bacterium]|nr:SH3 domain-containing protein [Clostridia bacterium]